MSKSALTAVLRYNLLLIFCSRWSFNLFNSLMWMLAMIQTKVLNCIDIANDHCDNVNRNTVMQDDWTVFCFLIVGSGFGGCGGFWL